MAYSDNETNVQEIKNAIDIFNKERGWNKHHSPRDLAISICLESAELLELFQWSDSDSVDSGELKSRIQEELADVLIYCVCMSNATGIDIADAVYKKLRNNAEKYPKKRPKTF